MAKAEYISGGEDLGYLVGIYTSLHHPWNLDNLKILTLCSQSSPPAFTSSYFFTDTVTRVTLATVGFPRLILPYPTSSHLHLTLWVSCYLQNGHVTMFLYNPVLQSISTLTFISPTKIFHFAMILLVCHALLWEHAFSCAVP